jgi:alpha-beta hydrolase superfamily lysophospholipase
VKALRRILEPEPEPEPESPSEKPGSGSGSGSGLGLRLVTPDLNIPSFERLDWPSIVSLGIETGRAIDPCAVVGSSLGALVALEVVRGGIARPLILIAPPLGLVQHWLPTLPPGDPVEVFHHARNANAPIHRKFFEQVAASDADRDPPPVPVTIFMGIDDETLPFERVEAVWQRWRPLAAPGSRFVAVPGGNHSLLSCVEEIATEIRQRCA